MENPSSFLKIISAFLLVLVFSIFVFTTSIDANTNSQQATFKSLSYKGNHLLKYPQVYGINKNAAITINSAFKKAAEKSFKTYLAVKKAEKGVPRKELCKKTVRCKYSFNSLYQVKYNSNGKLSIYYSEYTYTGGSHGKTKVSMYNFDLSTGRPYNINDILKTSCTYKKVQKYAFNYLSTHELYSDSVVESSDVTVNQNTPFSFSNDGIYLFFTDYKKYEPSYDDGNPFIEIPKSVYK
ncbi:DUF4163 domain-containing protein [Peribacillus muralis]|uniref:DUF4163 domain-containing protein n=1 Tax=Peribacillus muralis TaxID=264697 RepID=UPI001F4E0880|nr:DUF4163 domain-containing protein [Peribacillus muralis]MCK1995107.1 DUF4163 domain-containing protein [Peribacillus muralis]MCK2015667.1 DUF4163 domain-containing protein [Peribacillus muralis]